ncbi:glutathione S-transferase T2-like [Eutrema salsugineum]|uniref:glutathione S-transferase T2-like n=1 Tax=Eutrema salsugineum TaxID=72664 RepID=UPI000CED1FC6|nr:glutathione S-transferase T2-like [Eutrema salsugineum]
MNDLVCKFSGAYEAATREKTSGMNENDVIKLAHQIFFTNQKKKFNLEHAWKELRYDQKCCENLSTTKGDASAKRRRTDECAASPGYVAEELKSGEDDLPSNRPIGVKATKAKGKRATVEEKAVALFDSLIEKKEALTEVEEAVKMKIMNDLLSS